jgi:hypothetical protein
MPPQEKQSDAPAGQAENASEPRSIRKNIADFMIPVRPSGLKFVPLRWQ